MNENTNTIKTESKIAAAEAWAQVKHLQEQLSSLQETTDKMFAINDADEHDGDLPISKVNEEVATAKIEAIKAVFAEREKTLQALLDFYITVYRDATKESDD